MSASSPPSSRSSSPDVETVVDSKKRKALPELEVDLAQPEPPSKKAKRALKKGKPLPDSKNPSAGDNDDDFGNGEKPAKDGKPKKAERSQHGVWIGNLPFTMTRPELFQWLVDNSGGSIKAENITRVNLPPSKIPYRSMPGESAESAAKKKTQNKGFAYVDFDTFEAKVAAIALSETEINARKLLIKDSKSFEGRPKAPAPEAAAATTPGKVKEEPAAPTSRKIFVGNMGFAITEDILWEHFAKCGEIDWVKVATFEDTGKCKGYGWVKFREPESVQCAVQGFVRIKEEESDDDEDEEDKQEEDTQIQDAAADEADAKDGEEAGVDGDVKPIKQEKPKATPKQPKKPKKPKMRKWWVNRLQGRELKVQIAEDDQTRYKKRYGKNGTKAAGKGAVAPPPQAAAEGAPTASGEQSAIKPRREKPTKFAEDINVARLTGGVVASQGKRTTFD